jgi:hypothetical protein
MVTDLSPEPMVTDLSPESFDCPICFETFDKSQEINIACGENSSHSHCLSCQIACFKKKIYTCSLCRAPIKTAFVYTEAALNQVQEYASIPV